MMQLAPIEQKSLADAVENKMLELFYSGQFEPGDPLPSETELAAQMNVSRGVVREAISSLRMSGFIDAKKKRGMQFKNPDVFGVMRRVIHPSVLDDSISQSLREMRLVIEIGLADLLFLRKTQEDIDILEDIVQQEERSVESRKQKVELDVMFHEQIYLATGNEGLQQFQNLLVPFFDDARMRYFGKTDNIVLPFEATHRGLLEIIKVGTPSQFREAMRKHLSIFLDKDSEFNDLKKK
jgi:GntR family transcriptional regulator, transcriptional repressor for pyruvate dehydrogenase complex